jgi:hypothetical protein
MSDKNYETVHLINSDGKNCNNIIKPYSKEGNKRWRKCFNNQATWIPKWITRVSQVQVKHEKCQSKIIPVVVLEHNSEWLLWWVPLPHVGGTPYSYFRIDITIEEKYCNKSTH